MAMAKTKTLRSAAQLRERGLIAPERDAALEAVAARYAVALPAALAALIDPADANDPIARQFVPDARELESTADELADPIGDDAHSPVPGIVHRYPDRVLLKLTQICAVYCRFCFRRETVGKPGALDRAALDAALDYIRDASRNLGGDPHRRRSAGAVGAAAARGACGRLARSSTSRSSASTPACRSPSRARSRAELVRAMKVKGKAVYVALHVNHPRELTRAARAAVARIADAGIPLLGQSVLLDGVNDTPRSWTR